MTQPPADSPHPAPDTLADLHAGLLDAGPDSGLDVDHLSDSEGADVRTHVAGCPSCTARLTQLDDTRLLLAGRPPIAMPADVGRRLDAALAAEAARSTAPRPDETSRVTVLASRAPARRRRWPAPASASAGIAAGVALLLAAVVGASSLLGHRSAATSASKVTSTAGAEDSTAGVAAPVLTSGRNYAVATLDDQVRELLSVAAAPGAERYQPYASPVPDRSAAPNGARAAAAATIDPALARLGRPAQLQACVEELAGRPGVVPITVDLARYQGKPAAIVVLHDPDPTKAQAWIVGTGCRRGQSDLLRYQVVPLAR